MLLLLCAVCAVVEGTRAGTARRHGQRRGDRAGGSGVRGVGGEKSGRSWKGRSSSR